MTWVLPGLGLVLLVVLFATLTGAKPSDARSVRHTKLMGVAKVVLLILAVGLVATALFS